MPQVGVLNVQSCKALSRLLETLSIRVNGHLLLYQEVIFYGSRCYNPTCTLPTSPYTMLTATFIPPLQIGESEGGICGHPWLTWGVARDSDCENSESGDSESSGDSDLEDSSLEDSEGSFSEDLKPGSFEKRLAPYLVEGFARVDLPTISEIQVGFMPHIAL